MACLSKTCVEAELSGCWRRWENAISRSFGSTKGCLFKNERPQGAGSWDGGRPRFQLTLEVQGTVCDRFRVQEDLLVRKCGRKA